MKSTATLAPVIVSTAAIESDLFGVALSSRPMGGLIVPIVSRTDATKTLGRKVTFDFKTLAEFKASLATNKDINAATKKKLRQEFLNGDSIKQRQMLGMAALQAAYQPDEFAPSGRVPDAMELRANGRLTLISVEKFIGKDKSETPKQKIERLERELREAKAAKGHAAAEEAVIVVEGEPESATAEA